MKKSVYKSAMSHVKTSENFEQATMEKLMQHMEQEIAEPTKSAKERFEMKTAMTKKSKVTAWAAGAATCAVLAAGILSLNQNNGTTEPVAQPTASTSQKPPIMGKMAVNIDGIISEVSADGKSFKVDDLWVTITPDTQMGIDGPTAAEPSDELLQKEFKVGNIVSGYTSDDVSTGKVNATRIYNNMAPQK